MKNRWSELEINDWAALRPWQVGCNFIPSYAINQIEMFAPETYDVAIIDRELGLAAALGFNTIRLFLHDLLWHSNAEGFKARLDEVLGLCQKHGLKALVVFFDDCWQEPRLGPQPEPLPETHNSGWARSPGKAVLLDRSQWLRLEAYVSDIVAHFASDERVLAWDVYNEPGNIIMPALSNPADIREAAVAKIMTEEVPTQSAAMLDLLHQAFSWVRAQDPTQPLTAGVYHDHEQLNATLFGLSDIISFHSYKPLSEVEAEIIDLKVHNRPIWCTEYLNRPDDNRFESHLPLFKAHKIGAWNWGFVEGKTNTKFGWSHEKGTGEPDPWFHDIYHTDGTPYDANEVTFLKAITSQASVKKSA
jgi:hypothetical protein